MKLLRNTFFGLIFLLPFLLHSDLVLAQSDYTGESPVTRTYALTNATIVQAPGKVIEGGTLIISDGLITAVGTNVSIPAHAQIIDATDHYIYPGFIDGMSHTGAERPDQPERPNNLFTPDPPNDYAGITPEQSVKHQIDVESNDIGNMRKLGFTISHTVPYGRMLPGSGALILLNDGSHTDDILMTEHVSMYTQFSGAPGAYPGNTLGIMAKWRNLYRNASLAKQHTEMYASNPTGLQRPSQNRVLQAFYPVVENSRPVFYNAPSLLEAQRALRLQDELGFNLVLGNLEEAWALQSQLTGRENVGVFLSLDVPDKPENMDDEDKSEEMAALEERRMEFYNRHMAQFDAFINGGILYGFSSIDASSGKIKDNLLAMMEHGLDSVEALAALTVNPAQILGISDVAGTLEEGKIGNAVISNGPYFKKGTNVKFVFVDGDLFEYEIRDGGSSEISEEAKTAVVGTWNYTSTSPQGEQTGQLIFKDEDGVLTGIWTSDNGQPDVDLSNVSYRDGTLSFDFQFEAGGQSIDIVVSGDVIGTEFDGEASIAAFNISFPLMAVKQNPEN